MKLLKFFAASAVASSLALPVQAERFTISIIEGGRSVTSFGASDNNGGYCGDGSSLKSIRVCSRTFWVCSKALQNARSRSNGTGHLDVRYSDRPGRPKAC